MATHVFTITQDDRHHPAASTLWLQDPTLDAIVLFTVLLLLACHGMARGWPAQLGGADGGGRAAALTRESPTIYGVVVSSWKALCRAWTSPPLQLKLQRRRARPGHHYLV